MYAEANIAAVERIARQDNFVEKPAELYTGVKDPALRARLNANVHACATAVADAARRGASSDDVIELIKESIWHIPRSDLDTEDAERYALAYEAMLDALEIESSNGVLNGWMYGPGDEA